MPDLSRIAVQYNDTVFYGAIAQLGERLPCTQEVSGSIPLSSTILFAQYPISEHIKRNVL